MPVAAQAQVVVPSATAQSQTTPTLAAQAETVTALLDVVPELEAEKNPDLKQMALQDIAASLASLGRQEEALSVPADQWALMDVPHNVALYKLSSGDLEGARKMIPDVRQIYSRADLLLAISRELVAHKQSSEALPLIRQAEGYLDPGASGSAYPEVGLLLAKCGDKTGALRAFQKGRQGIDAQVQRMGKQPGFDAYGELVPAMIRAGFVDRALPLAAKERQTPTLAIAALLESGAAERAIQFAASLTGPGQAVEELDKLVLAFAAKGQVQNARRVLNLARQKARAGLTEKQAQQAIASWIYGFALLGDLNASQALLTKVPEMKSYPGLEMAMLQAAATTPVRDAAVEKKRTIWLQRIRTKLQALPVSAPERGGGLTVASYLLTRGRKQEALAFLKIADTDLKNLPANQRAFTQVMLARQWLKAGAPARARELATEAANTAEGQEAWVIQVRLAEAGFKPQAVLLAEKRAQTPKTGYYEWRQAAAEQSSIQPAAPAGWISKLTDPTQKAAALCGWAAGLVKTPPGTSMSGGPLISP